MIPRVLVIAICLLLAGGCVDKPTEHRVRANAYLRGGDATKALEEIKLGLAHDEKNLSLLVLRGKALFELERYDQAKVAYDAALSIGSDSGDLGEAHLGLAMVAMRQKRWRDARMHFKSLVDQNGKDADARLNLARVCLQINDMECALEHGVEAGHIRGKSEDVLFTLGRIYVAAKKYEEAEKTFQRICQVVPNAASCPYGEALVAAQKGEAEKALTKLREAIALKLPNPEKLGEDPMLSPLKDNPDFAKLVADAKGG